MQITSNNYDIAALSGGGMNPATVKRSDEAFLAMFDDTPKDAAEELREITRGGVTGMMAWKIEQMKKDAAEKALAARGMSVDDVQALPEQQRVELQQQIMNEVAEVVKKAIEEDMHQKQAETLRRAEMANQAQSRGGLDILA